MLLWWQNVITAERRTTLPISVPSLVMMNDARRLVMHEQRPRKTQEVEVVAAAVVKVYVELVVMVILVSVLLGINQRAPTLALR